MARGYLEIDGKKIELTDEQVEKLLIEEKKNPFNRIKEECYYYISPIGTVSSTNESYYRSDDNLYDVANYCTDKELMKQRALHETLDRLLWRFSMQNDGDKIDWDNHFKSKYTIFCNKKENTFSVYDNEFYKSFNIYFYSQKIAQRAINEIILPFIKEHPEFVW